MKFIGRAGGLAELVSSSTRRTWIEIPPVSENNPIDVVVLHTEDVD